jgi:hypothetical protein
LSSIKPNRWQPHHFSTKGIKKPGVANSLLAVVAASGKTGCRLTRNLLSVYFGS